MKKVLTLAMVALMSVVLVACGSYSQTKYDENEAVLEENQNSKEEESKVYNLGDEIDFGESAVKIDSVEKSETEDGQAVAIVTYDFTNKNVNSKTADDVISMSVLQNGRALKDSFNLSDSKMDKIASSRQVKNGETIEKCQKAFLLQDESPVSISVNAVKLMVSHKPVVVEAEVK